MPCHCPQCADQPQYTYTREHLQRCEARTVMRWPQAQRQDYYKKIAQRRGDNAARKLIDLVKEEWSKAHDHA